MNLEASEQEILKSIIQVLTLKRIMIVHVRNTGSIIQRDGKTFFGKGLNQRGAPDLIFAYKGVPVACEVKSRKGRVRPEQEEWLAKWTSEPSKGHSFIARSVDDVLAQLSVIDSRLQEVGRPVQASVA